MFFSNFYKTKKNHYKILISKQKIYDHISKDIQDKNIY
jgi:hypothetical protein